VLSLVMEMTLMEMRIIRSFEGFDLLFVMCCFILISGTKLCVVFECCLLSLCCV